MKRPKDGPSWMRWVERELAQLRNHRAVQVPVAGMALWPASAGTPPPNWLSANGATFDGTQFPVLADRLGSTTLPNPAAVSGAGWIIRAG